MSAQEDWMETMRAAEDDARRGTWDHTLCFCHQRSPCLYCHAFYLELENMDMEERARMPGIFASWWPVLGLLVAFAAAATALLMAWSR